MRNRTKTKNVPLNEEDLIKKSKHKALTNDELLFMGSRIFYHPVSVLEICKGESEYDKRPAVTTAFNLLRAIDNIEDGKIDDKDKSWLILTFVNNIINPIVRRDSSESIDDILYGESMITFCDSLVEGSRNEAETIFAKNFRRGVALQNLHSFDTDIKGAIEHSCLGIAAGMTEFLARGEIQDLQQLDSYCYYVAGRFGSFLTQLVKFKDKDEKGNPISLDSMGAERFGAFLQLVNIAQNVRKDWVEGQRVYFPALLRSPTMAHKYLVLGAGADARNARKDALDNILSRAEEGFQESAAYVSTIPSDLRGYKAFSLMLLVSGKTMLEKLKEVGAEAVFNGDENLIMPSKNTLQNIYSFFQLIAKKGMRTDYWLENYAMHPTDFSFENGKFRSWASEYFSQSTSSLKP